VVDEEKVTREGVTRETFVDIMNKATLLFRDKYYHAPTTVMANSATIPVAMVKKYFYRGLYNSKSSEEDWLVDVDDSIPEGTMIVR
jgi:hypothetical protein